MKLALFKGRKRIFNVLIAAWTKGQYSHCELVFSDGMCGSASHIDGCVRLKRIQFDPELWDFIDIPGDEIDEAEARKWYEDHRGEIYDYVGLLGFVIRPVTGRYGRWLCSSSVMEALGYDDSWRFCPNLLATIFKGPRKKINVNTNV
jgi:hypothetical protein